MSLPIRFSGSIPAIVTPLTQDEVDFETAASLASRVASHAKAVVVAGSTGEGTSLSSSERNELYRITKTAVGAKVSVIAGVSAAATRDAVQAAVDAEAAGANAILMSTPYYAKPGEDGIILHFQAVAKATSIPIILYNIPSRTGCNLSKSSIIDLWNCGAISGLKEAAQNARRINEIASSTDPSFAIFCGDDVTSFEMLSAGACGTISVVANLLPELCATAHKHFQDGETSVAEAIFARLKPLVASLGEAPNPTGVKYAMYLLGLCQKECRLPLTEVSPDIAHNISKSLKSVQNKNLQQALDGASQCKPMIYL